MNKRNSPNNLWKNERKISISDAKIDKKEDFDKKPVMTNDYKSMINNVTTTNTQNKNPKTENNTQQMYDNYMLVVSFQRIK